MLSFPKEGLTLAIDFQNKGASTLKMLEDLDKIIMSAAGRIYPAKDARMSEETFLKSFVNFNDFKKFIDPLFSSSFLKKNQFKVIKLFILSSQSLSYDNFFI